MQQCSGKVRGHQSYVHAHPGWPVPAGAGGRSSTAKTGGLEIILQERSEAAAQRLVPAWS